MKAKIDYDPKKFTSDGYGNLSPITKDKTHYKGHIIDIGLSKVKVWLESDNSFYGEFPDVATAKADIDANIK